MRSFWTLILLIAMCFAAKAQASEAPRYAQGGEIVNVQHTPQMGFTERYFPFSLSPNLHPEVEDAKVLTWVGSICFLGGLGAWIGSMISLDNAPTQSDALEAGLIHFVFEIAMSWLVVTYPIACLDSIWFAPIAVLNAWDRAYKGSGNKPHSVQGLVAPPAMAMAY